MIHWEFKAREFVHCNCAYGCPCQFNAPPTHGHCQAVAGFDIVEGHFGNVRLDGLRAVGIMRWPGPIHHGRGEALMIIDERADEVQRKALLAILSGEETEPGKTIWNVFAATFERIHEPQFRPIAVEVDVERRRGRISVDGLVDVVGEPIRNPVTGAEHRVRIDIPDGFEYRIAEMGSARSRIAGPIPLELDGTYAQFAYLHLNQNGIVHSARA
jgi:hypothetical protein